MRYLMILMVLMILSMSVGCSDREEIHEILKGAYYDLHESSASLKRIAISMEKIEEKL